MFHLYLQSSSASRQPKISNLMFHVNPVYIVRSHPMTRLDTNYRTKLKILLGNCKTTNGECIYCKTVDYMSRMALEKDYLEGF